MRRMLLFSLCFFAVTLRAQIIPQPEIASISPSQGPYYSVFSLVTITGTNLLGGCGSDCRTRVLFDGEEASVYSQSETQLTLTPPPHRIGAADVRVVRADGASNTKRAGYVYLGATTNALMLLPLTIEETSGASGTRWSTDLWVLNRTNSAETIADPSLTIPIGGALRNPAGFVAGAGELPGRLVYVSRDEVPPEFHLRLQEQSRGAEHWGVEIPVVHEEDFRVSRIDLLDIPTDRSFRVALRTYAIPTGAMAVGSEQESGGQLDVFSLDSCCDSAPILSTSVVLKAPAEASGPLSVPLMFQNFDLVGSYPELLAASRVRVVFTPFIPITSPPSVGPLIWAFASITHNQTQHVTLVTPQ